MKSLKIGLDFDGVVANTPRLTSEIAAQKFGIYLPDNGLNIDYCLKKGFTEKSYRQLQEIVYSSYNLRPVMGAIKYIRQLIENNQDLMIVSYREKRESKIIKHFLDQHDFDLDYICTDNRPKSQFCEKQKLDVFFDDRLEHLLDLSDNVKYLFLFAKPYNKEEQESHRVKVVHSWREFYEKLGELKF